MRCACIDIGSNTTRVLVADVVEGRLEEVLVRRAFTRLGRELRRTGRLPTAALDLVARTVAEQRVAAEEAGAQRLRVVATAAIRGAVNGGELCRTVHDRAGVPVAVLQGEEEARLAFTGATATLLAPPAGRIAVVDIGGGSSEIAVGRHGGPVEWSASVALGSGTLAEAHQHGDPPGPQELDAVREEAAAAIAHLKVPAPDVAVAVGGSATSTARLVGPRIDVQTVRLALESLCGAPAERVAARHDLDPERVRLLPAGLLMLAAVSDTLGIPLQVGRGGLREGVCLELAVT
jgi:exopolyphosphatase/guanosine-5'-triphosphate,3'-diphosphate pyrophosphatase